MFGERKINYIKQGTNRNLIKLSTAYENNCSENEYEEVNDEVLTYILEFERECSKKGRNERKRLVPFPKNDMEAVRDGVITISAEEQYLSERDDSQLNELREIFNKLSRRQRKRLYMKFFMNMSFTEIAQHENAAVSSVYESCNRALKALNEYGEILQKSSIRSWAELLI